MPRIGRLHIPGGYYHVMGRGLERRFIFKTSTDKGDFLSRFGVGLNRANARCLAWALMSNHYHFLIQVGQDPLSRLMASVLGGYASSYNRRNNRCGYVFQNRYKSILIDADSYLIELVRYIHLNPVRAGMVEGVLELGSYPWTGHAGMLGRYKQEWHSVNEALQFYAGSTRQAKIAYLDFLRDINPIKSNLSGGGLVRSHGGWQGLEQLRREHTVCIGDERILGSSEFVESVLAQDNLSTELRAKLVREDWDIEKLAHWVCESMGTEKEQLFLKARGGKRSAAKSVLCYLGSSELGLNSREIAKYLSISQPSVSAWVGKGEAVCRAKGLSLESIYR